jgi:hypothetical protein
MKACEYCDKSFSTNTILKRHQTSLKCLRRQKELSEKYNVSEYISLRTDFKNQEKEMEKIREENAKLREKIIDLKISNEKEKVEIYKKDGDDFKQCVKKIANKHKNSITNNLGTFDEDKVSQRCKDNIGFFTKKHFLNGQKGASDFTIEYVLKDDE